MFIKDNYTFIVFPIHIGINQGFNLVNGKAVSR